MSEISNDKKTFQIDIQNFGKMESFSKGETILISSKEFAWFITQGKIKVFDTNLKTGKEQALYILRPGDIYSISNILETKEDPYTITAIEDSKIITLPINIIRKWIDENKDFRDYFFKYIAFNLRELESLTLDLSLKNSLSRLIKLIFESANKNSKKYELIKGLNHEEIAAIIGSVRNVVNRDIQKLKKENIIEVKRKNIEVKRLPLLKELAEDHSISASMISSPPSLELFSED